jgi:hypothetical protein
LVDHILENAVLGSHMKHRSPFFVFTLSLMNSSKLRKSLFNRCEERKNSLISNGY